jgi:hypothetical protein
MLTEDEAVIFNAARESGQWADMVAELRAAWMPLLLRDERVAPVLRSRRRSHLRVVAS